MFWALGLQKSEPFSEAQIFSNPMRKCGSLRSVYFCIALNSESASPRPTRQGSIAVITVLKPWRATSALLKRHTYTDSVQELVALASSSDDIHRCGTSRSSHIVRHKGKSMSFDTLCNPLLRLRPSRITTMPRTQASVRWYIVKATSVRAHDWSLCTSTAPIRCIDWP
jgi:hypothetical protein